MWKRCNSFEELNVVRREIDRVFEGYQPRTGRPYSAFLPGAAARSYPLMNVTENAEEYTVEALAPGLDVASLDVSVKGKQMTISGQKMAIDGVEPQQYHRSERSTGRFVRTVTLGDDIETNNVSARYVSGILMVTLPKAESAKATNIKVDVA